MKGKLLLSFIASFLTFMVLFSPNSFAAEKSNVELDFDPLEEQLLQEIKKTYPNAQFIDLTEEEYSNLQNKHLQSNDDVGIMAPAPPLSFLQVYAVRSSNYLNFQEYEYFSENQMSSLYDHGGSQMQIVTVELGYGQQGVAKMNNIQLSLIQSRPIDLNGDYIVDGFFKWWNANGYQSGTFSYQNTSLNSPWNTMYDSIYIK